MAYSVHGHHNEYETEYTQLRELEQTSGKTVSEAFNEGFGVAVIVFADKTFLRIDARVEYEDEASIEFGGLMPSCVDALTMGLIDQAEFDRANAAHKAKSEARDRARKLEQLKELQAELGVPMPF